jgi:hypothetical protein
VPVHGSELEFVFEVGHCAKPADDDGQAIVPREIDRQAFVGSDFDAVDALERRSGELDTFLEEWRSPRDRTH